jgi:cell division protein FtsB
MSWEQDPWLNPEFRMARKSQQRDWRSGRKRVLTIIGLTIGLYGIYLLVGGEFGLWRLQALEKREGRLAGEIASAQERVDLLKRDLGNINETREREAREGFGFARSNEVIYEIMPADSVTGGAPGMEPEGVAPGSDELGSAPVAPRTDDRAGVSKRVAAAPSKKAAVKGKSGSDPKKPVPKTTKHPVAKKKAR